MKLDIYKNQTEVDKTYEVANYDLMYGTIEDIFDILEDADTKDDGALFDLIAKNRRKINDLLLDIFGGEGLTEEELRRVKVKDLIPLFVDLFAFVADTFGDEKN